jgi:hypothetical protein
MDINAMTAVMVAFLFFIGWPLNILDCLEHVAKYSKQIDFCNRFCYIWLHEKELLDILSTILMGMLYLLSVVGVRDSVWHCVASHCTGHCGCRRTRTDWRTTALVNLQHIQILGADLP